MPREGRAARRPPGRARAVDPNHPPFSLFLERDALRETRQRGRRWTLIVSLGVHLLAVVAVLLYSLFDIDELIAPSVEVKMYAPGSAEVPAQAPMTRTIRTGPSGIP
jgi:hypothetical protein